MCATSIGSTFSHSPVPGERKSGIPDGTEIPAPVRATTEPASRMREASRATRSLVVVGGDIGDQGRRLLLACYRPVHTGLRLPRKAVMPSLPSALAKTAAKAAF